MGGDIGEIQLGSERELYKYIFYHYAIVSKGSSKIILVQVGVHYICTSGLLQRGHKETPKFILWETYKTSP